MKRAAHPPQAWAQFIRKVRDFFDSQDFLEVFTSSLVPVGAFENAIDPLQVHFQGGTSQLHTSPEIEMKVILSQEQRPIYQICKCFRDDPDTQIHFKEFTMLEFYRPHCNYSVTRNDMKALIQSLSKENILFQELSIQEAFQKFASIELSAMSCVEVFLETAKAKGLTSLSPRDTWEDIFFRVMIEKIEPALEPNVPTLLFDYPASVSTLSKPKNAFWGERFEIYWQGMEICNGASELTSAEVLRERYEFETNERLKAGKSPHPFPQRLSEALATLPPCSGVAVGLDRLFWALQSTSS